MLSNMKRRLDQIPDQELGIWLLIGTLILVTLLLAVLGWPTTF